MVPTIADAKNNQAVALSSEADPVRVEKTDQNKQPEPPSRFNRNGIGFGPASDHAPDAGAIPGQERRVVALDGLRGLMAILVVVSHYLGEVPHGVRFTMLGWIAVDMFFALSGYLVGKLILEREQHANFFTVFYVRRFCRTIPPYLVTVIVLFVLLACIERPWVDADTRFPLWSYLSFSQNFFMIATGSIGAHWLAPTWTLVVEEHFYLLIPALMVFVPRRRLVAVLLGIVAAAVLWRIAICHSHLLPDMAALVLLPSRADVLVCGILAAVAVKTPGIPWQRLQLPLRLLPIAMLVGMIGLKLLENGSFETLAPLLAAIGCATFILTVVLGAPEAKRFHAPVLRFFGDNGYCLYLTHLPVLGLMHGILLGTRPDLETPYQWLVTIAALPLCTLIGWGMTRLIEEPCTACGRSWRWSAARRSKRRHDVDPGIAGSAPRLG
jgi:peptidoglycan/LPS O-acetylase OafA/YrhL